MTEESELSELSEKSELSELSDLSEKNAKSEAGEKSKANVVARVLIVDDEEAICSAFQRFFRARGWTVETVSAGGEGLARYAESPFDVVFLDVRLPDGSGLDFLRTFRENDPEARVILITAFGDMDVILNAAKAQAFEYLPKPIDLDDAFALAERAVVRHETPPEESPEKPSGLLVGRSTVMQRVFKQIARLAHSDASVLILGATGTGKEMVARAIHENSDRQAAPFVAVNCGSLPESLVESELFGHVRGAFTGADSDRTGRFEAADGGTLLLDEIGDLPPPAQVKLLRVLDSGLIERVGSVQSKKLDVRILAATNRNLEEAIDEGRFRSDLYYRIATVRIEIPPLAKRKDDIRELITHFISATSRKTGTAFSFDDEFLAALLGYNWPGNVRELRNAVEYACLMSPNGRLTAADLDGAVRLEPASPARRQQLRDAYLDTFEFTPGEALDEAVGLVEEEMIRRALDLTGGNRSEAAAWLGIHRNTLRSKLKEVEEGE